MKNLRTYGKSPFNVVVIHGGPGAPGHMAPVARELSPDWGVLEPLQTATSLEGQIQELRAVLEKNGDLPVTLIGSSWGAMLGFIFSARYPAFVKKLILIGSGVYEERYAAKIRETRLSRLSEEERREVHSVMEAMKNPAIRDKNTLLARFGKLFTKADAYNPLTLDTEDLEAQYHIYQSVWNDATELRSSGELLKLGNQIQCPVVAIHGDYDPHPPEGVKRPLAKVLRDFQFILLKNCGHLPWIEREAKGEFYEILKKELR
ncbi:MAG: alpha/beta hydrolase [Anaerolineae bacterium]|nr:alpha/beta hydrolase [Anaerolineae bacterium]